MHKTLTLEEIVCTLLTKEIKLNDLENIKKAQILQLKEIFVEVKKIEEDKKGL